MSTDRSEESDRSDASVRADSSLHPVPAGRTRSWWWWLPEAVVTLAHEGPLRSPTIIMALFLTSALPIMGQTEADSAPSSGSGTALVLGLGLGGGTLGMAWQGSVGVTTRFGDFLVRSAGTEEIDLSNPIVDSSSDVALLFGLHVRRSKLWMRAAAGPARVHTVRNLGRRTVQTPGSYTSYTEQGDTSTLGVALQLDMVWGERPGFGLGVLGNMNGERSFALVTVGLHYAIGGRPASERVSVHPRREPRRGDSSCGTSPLSGAARTGTPGTTTEAAPQTPVGAGAFRRVVPPGGVGPVAIPSAERGSRRPTRPAWGCDGRLLRPPVAPEDVRSVVGAPRLPAHSLPPPGPVSGTVHVP